MKQCSECVQSVWINTCLKKLSYATEKSFHPHSVGHGSVDNTPQLESNVGRFSVHIFNRAMSTADRIKTGKTENTRASVGHDKSSYSTAVINQTEVFWLLHREAAVMRGVHLQLWCSTCADLSSESVNNMLVIYIKKTYNI